MYIHFYVNVNSNYFPLFSPPKKNTLHEMIAKPPQHILFVLDYYLPHLGGLEIVFSHIIQGLLQQGHHVGIITTQHFATLPAYEKHEHLTIRRVGRTREQFIRKAFWQILRVAKTYDCIHTTTYASAIPSSIAGRRCNRNVVLTVHEVFGTLWKRYKVRSRPFRFFEWLIFQFRYAAIVAVSAYTQKHLQTLYALDTTKVRLIHNGVDTTFWQEKNINPSQVATFKKTHHLDDKLVLLYYGHSGVSKGLDRLIHALPLLKKHYPTFHFLANIIPGKRDHHLYRLLKKNHVQDYTTLLHGVEQQHLLTII